MADNLKEDHKPVVVERNENETEVAAKYGVVGLS